MKPSSLLLVLPLAVFASGCGGMLKARQAAEEGVAEFHKLFNDESFAKIYAAADARFRTSTTEQEFVDLIGTVRQKLGKVTQTASAGVSIRSVNLTTTAVLKQTTTFEQGTATETFTFQMEGENAILLGYNINSKDLILK
jgi:hypothetical protein